MIEDTLFNTVFHTIIMSLLSAKGERGERRGREGEERGKRKEGACICVISLFVLSCSLGTISTENHRWQD